MTTLTLSGWAQPATALSHLAEVSVSFDYSDYTNPNLAIEALKNINPSTCIAWSLGGVVALRAIAAGAIAPAHLTLIGVPYQFVQTPDFSHAMGADTYQKFHANYTSNPSRTKDRFLTLIAKGDRDDRRILQSLTHHHEVENTARWLPWLGWLGTDNLGEIASARLPPTLIIHGEQDAIVHPAQATKLREVIPHAMISLWSEVGHAPHMHDVERLRAEIAAHRKAHA